MGLVLTLGKQPQAVRMRGQTLLQAAMPILDVTKSADSTSGQNVSVDTTLIEWSADYFDRLLLHRPTVEQGPLVFFS